MEIIGRSNIQNLRTHESTFLTKDGLHATEIEEWDNKCIIKTSESKENN